MISTGVDDKHGCLGSWLILISSVRADDKFNTIFVEFIFELMPIIPFSYNPEMHSWYLFTINWIGRHIGHLGYEVRYNLMSEEIEDT